MSYVTSITIAVDYAPPDFEAAVTAPSNFGREGALVTSLRALDMDASGGTKYPSHSVFAAGLNYADREALVAWVDALPWRDDLTHGVVVIDSEGDSPEVLVYGVTPRVTT